MIRPLAEHVVARFSELVNVYCSLKSLTLVSGLAFAVLN